MLNKIFYILPILTLSLLSCSSQNNDDGWKLVWADEFDYTGLPDSTKWSYETRGNTYGWGNNELQWYNVANINNTYVSDGTLKIVARIEDTDGKNTLPEGSTPRIRETGSIVK